MPIQACRLYAFVDTAYLHGRDPALVAQQLCDGGADLIQLRAKNSPEPENMSAKNFQNVSKETLRSRNS